MRREAGRMDGRHAVTERFRELALAIEQAVLVTRKAPKVTPDPSNTGWMPFNLFDAAALLFEAIPMIPDAGRYLEVGAGTGPNMIIAREFGLDVHGIEVHDELAAAARELGLPVETADAVSWSGYGKFDVIWMNRPVRYRGTEAELEQRVFAEMAPGAVIICANLENRPPEPWFIINDSWDSLRRGSWVKPHTATEGWA
jgi:hypothetical protein